MIDTPAVPERTTPRGVFGMLIRCECGHGIGAHARSGCGAGVYAGCTCRLTDGAAMARAIERASKAPGDRKHYR